MNVLIVSAHPRKKSFSMALSEAYIQGVLEAGKNYRHLILADLDFNPNVLTHSPKKQKFENDLLKARDFINWADHLVFVYPTWWGSVPALLKAFIDRVFTAGYAFEEVEGGTGYSPLLKGKTAQLITTMDTPLWVYKWIYRSPGHRSMSIATLKFCGIKPVRILSFSSVRHSTEKQRRKWLDQTRQKAVKLKEGHLSRGEKIQKSISEWFQAIRLQFYPMTAIAYTLGALAAGLLGYNFNHLIFWFGLLWVFFLEVATVLLNEKQDYESDKENKYFSPFSGGSRVIVDNVLTMDQVKNAVLTCILLSSFFASILLILSSASMLSVFLLILISTFLAFGYSVPPFKFDYRGLGALDVSITHSFGVIVCGFVFQGGSWNHPLAWMLSIPLFLSILPSIILSAIPDRAADKKAGKKTLAVIWGKRFSAKLAFVFSILASVTGILWHEMDWANGLFGPFIYVTALHAAYLCHKIYEYLQLENPPKRIDQLMMLSLSYILWFVLVPIFSFI